MPLSLLAWVLWRSDAAMAPGPDKLRVRAWDGRGVAQDVEARKPHPSGASALRTAAVRV